MNRFLKKIISVTMSVSMLLPLGALTPSVSAAEEAEEYRVDFTDVHSLSDLKTVSLSNPANAEIVTEENGNKALKINGSQVLFFNAPTACEGEVIVEYKFKTEGEAYQSVDGQPEWGSACSSTGQRSLRTTLYTTGLLAYGKPDNPNHHNYVHNMTIDSDWHSVKYMLDLNAQTGSLYLDGSIVSIWGVEKWNFQGKPNNIKQLLFNNDSKNVMYFDDIVIKNFPPANGEWGFENISSIEELSGAELTGRCEIAEDPENLENHMLKLTDGGNVTFFARKTKQGKATVEYSYKTATAAAPPNDQTLFGTVKNENRQVVRAITFLKKMCLFYGSSNEAIVSYQDNETKWTTIRYVIDFNNKTFECYKNGELATHWYQSAVWGFYDTENTAIDRIIFQNPDGQVIYLDNIRITEDENTPLNPTVKEVSIENGAEEVGLDAVFQITCSKPISISDKQVIITENGLPIDSEIVLSEDGYTAEIQFEKTYGMLYHIAIRGVTGIDGGLLADYETSFRTETQKTYLYCKAGAKNGDGTIEKPFGTINQAKSYLRTIRNSIEGDVYVKIYGGKYCETLSFTENDRLANGGVIYYTAADQEQPVLSGGIEVTGWTLHDAKRGIYKANVSDVDNFRQLYINGRRAVRARSTDSMGIHAYNDKLCVTEQTEIASWKNLSDVEIIFAILWTNPILSVQSVSVVNGKAYIRPNQIGYQAVNEKNGITAIYSDNVQREAWYVENAYELLDECGEWYFDKKTKTVYYKPMPYEDMNQLNAVIPSKETLISISGAGDSFAGGLAFEGLKLQHTTWLRPSTEGYYIGAQNNVDNSISLDRHGVIYAGMVEMRYADQVTFSDCVFSGAGSNGIVMREGVKNTKLSYCNIFDIAGGGIYVGPVRYITSNYAPSEENRVENIEISDCIIHNTGEDYRSASAVSAGFPVNAAFVHNEIYNTSYNGFHIGYGWTEPAEGQTGGAKIKIQNNYLHDILTSELYDGGAVYTLGGTAATPEQPNVVSGNYIKNQYHHFGALYNDEGSNDWLLEENVFDNTEAESLTGRTIRWLHWHTSSIKDCIARNNYSTTNAVYNQTSGNSVYSNLTVFDPQNPPQRVKDIIENAGVRAQSKKVTPFIEYRDQSVLASFSGAWQQWESQDAAAYAAVYQNGRLTGVQKQNVRLNYGVTPSEKIKITGLEPGEYTGKLFLWNPENMQPIAESGKVCFTAE